MKTKGSEILKFILLGVGVAGLLVVAVTAPGLFSALGPFNSKRYKSRQFKRSFDYAKERGLVTLRKKNDGYLVSLTEKGKQKMQQFRLGQLSLPRPKKWDGKWRIVLFDIPEKYKINRTVFSGKLKELGLVQMQKSAWVWPYPLGEEIELLKESYEIRPFVRVVTAADIDRKSDLLKAFNLTA